MLKNTRTTPFLFIALCLGACSKDAEVEVQGHEWKREVLVETMTPHDETEWCDDVPHGVTIRSRYQDKKTTRKVKVGQSCETVRAHCDPAPKCDTTPKCEPIDLKDCKVVDNGDGTMDEKCPEPKCSAPKCPEPKCYPEHRECHDNFVDEPVFASKCNFTILRWKANSAWETATGQDLNPTWPEPKLRTCEHPDQAGCQRIAKRSEHYAVRFRDENGKSFPCSYPEQHWRTFAVDSKWVTIENRVTGNPDCNTMRRK